MLEIIVHAGDLTRSASLVTAPVPAARLLESGALRPGPIADQIEGGAVLLQDDAGGAGPIVAQYDSAREELVFVLPGSLEAGASRRLRVLENTRADTASGAGAPFPVRLLQKLDRVIFVVGGQPFATYNIMGARRPYFWPVIGPSGASVIRGQGTAEHPHHTGMGINYGGHSEGGSTNIWSDWDEPPYGPGGRMLHRGFRRLTSGPVFGEIVQDLTYVNTYGDPIVDEVRTIRCWWASNESRFMDFEVAVLSARDRGPQPFLFMMRFPGSFDIPKTGRTTNSEGVLVEKSGRGNGYVNASWADGSGPTGDPPPGPPIAPPEVLVDMPGAPKPKTGPGEGPWNGVAVFDHPENHGFPARVGKYSVAQQITMVHYPPPEAPNGPFSFKHRVYIHDGDAEAGGVASLAAQYARCCQVEVP